MKVGFEMAVWSIVQRDPESFFNDIQFEVFRTLVSGLVGRILEPSFVIHGPGAEIRSTCSGPWRGMECQPLGATLLFRSLMNIGPQRNLSLVQRGLAHLKINSLCLSMHDSQRISTPELGSAASEDRYRRSSRLMLYSAGSSTHYGTRTGSI